MKSVKIISIILIIFIFNSFKCNSVYKTTQVLEIKKKMMPNDTSFSKQCADWNLNENSVLEIIKGSEVINSHDKNYIFNTLPCEFVGKIKVKGIIYNYIINAGAYTILFNTDTTIYLGYFKVNRNLFLNSPN